MPKFTGNQRFDPYKNFKFLVKCDGVYVAGVSKVSTLKRASDVVKHRDGGDPSSSAKSPSRTKYEPITLERGVTYDSAFAQWAGHQAGLSGKEGSRKELIIEVQDEAGQTSDAYQLHRCWVSEFQATPDLDGKPDAIVIQHIKLENEGWEPDLSAAAAVRR